MSLELSKKALRIKPSSTLELTAKIKSLNAKNAGIIGFTAGEPDFNTPKFICDAAKNAIDNGFTKYTPASGIVELKQAISDKFKKFNNLNYDIDQIVISNGGKHSLSNIFKAILNDGDEVILIAPYWLTYVELIRLNNGIPKIIYTKKEDSFKVNIDELENIISDKTKALVLNSPCNPTGVVYSKEELIEISKLSIKYGFYVISDEIYEYLTYDNVKHISIGSLNEDIYKNTITCSGVSKSYAMTGWRIGYVGAPKNIIKVISSIQSHETSNPNSIAQKAALAALIGDQSEISYMINEFDKRRKYILNRINNMKYISTISPKGAFYVFVDFNEVINKKYNKKTINDIKEVMNILIDDFKVAAIPCIDFGFSNYIRLSYAISLEVIEEGMNRINKFLNSLE